MITPNQISWVSGLLEGEGSFAYYKVPTIDIGMTDFDVLIKLSNIMSSNSNVNKHGIDMRGDRKRLYRYKINGNLAIQWMMTLYPLMGERRKARIREVITEWKSSNTRQRTKYKISAKEYSRLAILRKQQNLDYINPFAKQ